MGKVNTKKPKAEISEQVKSVLREEKTRQGRNVLRVVVWIIDGQSKLPQLEKRAYRTLPNGKEMGKRMGLTSDDCAFIVDNWDDIKMQF